MANNKDVVQQSPIKKYNDRLVDIPPEIEKEREASMKLCQVYFDIAAEAIGEDAVREKRDKKIGRLYNVDTKESN